MEKAGMACVSCSLHSSFRVCSIPFLSQCMGHALYGIYRALRDEADKKRVEKEAETGADGTV